MKLFGICNVKLKTERGFSLLEMIGVLAIIAIMAAVVAPSLVKRLQIDRQGAEEKILRNIAAGLTSYVLETRIIPPSGYGSSTWSGNIATQTHMAAKYVHENDQECRRRYWFDPSTDLDGLSGGGGVAYDQNTTTNISGFSSASTALPPTNPRAMIISDLTAGCTHNINGVADNVANFATVWNQSAPPADLAEGSTLKIQRINLSGLFETVTLQSSSGSIFIRQSYERPPSLLPYSTDFTPGPVVRFPVLTTEKNSHIFSIIYSTNGFEPTNMVGGMITVEIGYTSGGNEFLNNVPGNVTTGTTSPPISISPAYTSINDINIGIELTIPGSSNVYHGNSGHIDITVQYQGEPQFKLEGQTGNPTTMTVTTAGMTEIRSFNVIDGTTIYLYDQSGTSGGIAGDLLLSAVIKDSTIFTYSPGPPTFWGR